jgi:hypothetical protein
VNLREIGWKGVGHIHLAQRRDGWRAVVNAVINLRVPAPRSLLVSLFVRYLFGCRAEGNI